MSDEKREIRWPKKEHLIEALKILDDFRAACRHQLDLGYWMTITFPSKHHINKILSTQYIDQALMRDAYGEGLTNQLLESVPLCKNYIAFLKVDNAEKNKN